jgi:hypothetical protein
VRFEQSLSSIALLGGFAFVVVCMLLANRPENSGADSCQGVAFESTTSWLFTLNTPGTELACA